MMNKKYCAHETAIIGEDCTIGEGTKIWHFSQILSGARIGKECVFGQNTFIADKVTVGNRVKVQNNVSLYNGLQIDDDVFLGPSCVFTNVKTPRAFINRRNEFQKTHIKTGASIGANATIVCGVTVGEYALIGAGAVVSKDVAPHSLVVGVPAEHIGWVCMCGCILDDTLKCEECALQFVRNEHAIMQKK